MRANNGTGGKRFRARNVMSPSTNRHHRACPGDPRLTYFPRAKQKTWMAGTSPAMPAMTKTLGRNRRATLLDDLRMSLIVDRDIGEIAVGHQDRMHLLAAQHPGLEMDRNRSLADPDQIGVHGNQIADENRLAEIHRVDSDGHRARFYGLGCKDSAADIHLAEQPAAENIAVLVGVGRHRQRADAEIAAWLDFRGRRGVSGCRVGHV